MKKRRPRESASIITILVTLLLLLLTEAGVNLLSPLLILALSTTALTLLIPTERLKVGSVTRWFIIFFVFAVASTVTSVSVGRSIVKLMLYLVALVTTLSVRAMSPQAKNLLRRLTTTTIVISSGVLAAGSLIALLSGPPASINGMNLIYPTFGHSHVVDYLIFGYPLTLSLIAEKRKRRNKIFLFAVLLLIVAGFVTSFSRGGILLFLLITLWAGRQLKVPSLVKTALKTVGLTVVVAMLAALFLFYRQRFMLLRPSMERSVTETRLIRELTFRWRVEFLRQAAVLVKEHPVVGTGLDTFRFFTARLSTATGAQSWYVHNHFAQLFAETGLFGGTAFFILVIIGLKKAYEKTKKTEHRLQEALFVAAVSSTLQATMDFNWQFSSVFYLFWLVLAIMS